MKLAEGAPHKWDNRLEQAKRTAHVEYLLVGVLPGIGVLLGGDTGAT